MHIGKKIVPSISDSGNTGCQHVEEWNWTLWCLQLYTKINSKCTPIHVSSAHQCLCYQCGSEPAPSEGYFTVRTNTHRQLPTQTCLLQCQGKAEQSMISPSREALAVGLWLAWSDRELQASQNGTVNSGIKGKYCHNRTKTLERAGGQKKQEPWGRNGWDSDSILLSLVKLYVMGCGGECQLCSFFFLQRWFGTRGFMDGRQCWEWVMRWLLR